MFGLDPRLVALFCVAFIVLGIINIIRGRKRLQEAKNQGAPTPWYKQMTILTGIEYILLSFTFLTSIGITYHWIPASLVTAAAPFYLFMLFASAILAGVVIYQGMNDSRRRRRSGTTQGRGTVTTTTEPSPPIAEKDLTPEQREALVRKRRDRRKKAAEARRRRAGKA